MAKRNTAAPASADQGNTNTDTAPAGDASQVSGDAPATGTTDTAPVIEQADASAPDVSANTAAPASADQGNGDAAQPPSEDEDESLIEELFNEALVEVRKGAEFLRIHWMALEEHIKLGWSKV
jgi:hypothetical protein